MPWRAPRSHEAQPCQPEPGSGGGDIEGATPESGIFRRFVGLAEQIQEQPLDVERQPDDSVSGFGLLFASEGEVPFAPSKHLGHCIAGLQLESCPHLIPQ